MDEGLTRTKAQGLLREFLSGGDLGEAQLSLKARIAVLEYQFRIQGLRFSLGFTVLLSLLHPGL